MSLSRYKADPFLERFVGRPAYLIECRGIDKNTIREALNSLPSGPAFITARTEAGHTGVQEMLTSAGFYPADVNMTLEAELKTIPGEAGRTRKVRESDREAVVELARTGFPHSRFHRDDNFTINCANTIKAHWADNFFNGNRGDAMIVAEEAGMVVGFLQLLKQNNSVVIDLVAVAEPHRSRGLGKAMLALARDSFPDSTVISTGTQAANIQSLKFYENLGFRMTNSTMILHYWKD